MKGRRKAAAGAAQKELFRNQVNFSLELEHHLLSASGFRNVIVSYTFFFSGRNGEENIDNDWMSNSAPITQIPHPEESRWEQKAPFISAQQSTHTQRAVLLSFRIHAWQGWAGTVHASQVLFLLTKLSVTSVFLPR